jgi:hypothetical protein
MASRHPVNLDRQDVWLADWVAVVSHGEGISLHWHIHDVTA